MKVFKLSTKIFFFPIYYLIHNNFIFGLFHKIFIKKFFYKNVKINLNIKDIPIQNYSSFLFRTYEYNDRKLVEKHIDQKNKCIIVGGGLGFIAALAFQKSDNAILIFEINKNIIENLTVNLKQNNIKYNLYQKNLILDISHDQRKFYYADKYFLNNSMYLKSSKEIVLENINKNQIQNFDSFNTMIIDGEGIEEYFIKNISLLKNIKYIILELHHNIFSNEEVSEFFNILKKNSFIQIDKCFNSYYFRKFTT